MSLSRDEIYNKVQGVLVDALGVDEDEVTPTATLSGDLGAESIDYLDIVFRLEKNFGIKIPRGELFPENLAGATLPKFRDGGLLITYAGGDAGLFSAIIGGWASGDVGSSPVTVPVGT